MKRFPFISFFIILLIFVNTFDAVANASSRASTTRKLCPAVKRCLARMDSGKMCGPLPVPERARFPLLSTFTIKHLRPGVWAYLDFAYMSLIMFRESKLVLVDFPEASNKKGLPFLTDAVLRILKGRKPTEIEMVYSHAHFDHIGGATRFYKWAQRQYPNAKIRVWGTRETQNLIKKSRTKRAILPDIIIKERALVKMGRGLDVQITVIGGHTAEDMLLYIPRDGDKTGIVMLVDVIFPRWAPYFNIALTQDVTRHLEVQKLVLNLDFDVFVGGHLQLGTKDDVMDSYQYVKDIIKAADDAVEVSDEALGNSKFAEVFNPSRRAYGKVWFAFREQSRIQVAKCMRTMIEKWGCRIGDVDIVIESHCFIAFEHRILEV